LDATTLILALRESDHTVLIVSHDEFQGVLTEIRISRASMSNVRLLPAFRQSASNNTLDGFATSTTLSK